MNIDSEPRLEAVSAQDTTYFLPKARSDLPVRISFVVDEHTSFD